ncbi:MAG: serine hydrolase domain-containing protein [Candidatus Izemoplasmatales bacterium]
MKEIDELLSEGVRNGDFPGASYAIVYVDKTIDSNYIGYKELVPELQKLEGNEIYDCASLTKVVTTTTLIMKLIELQFLKLDTKVSSILPWFQHLDIEIKHLLTHSSGLPADIQRAADLKTKEDVLFKVKQAPLIYPTGSKVIYSDIGYILLGWVIETVTNKPLDLVAKEYIYDPLGMKDTSFSPDSERTCPTEMRVDHVYSGILRGKVHDEKSFAMNGVAGHAGMFSTVGDLSKFIFSILKNDEKILKKETVDSLFPPRIIDLSEGTKIRSYGWDKPSINSSAGTLVDFDHTILHTGFTGCNLWMDTFHGIGFVMLSNAVHPKRERNRIFSYRGKIADIILSSMGVKEL